MSRLATFHNILAGCQRGDAEAWRLFLVRYTPVAFRLFDVYLGAGSPESREAFWRDALGALAVDDYRHLKSFATQAEREFLADLRRFLLRRGGSALDPTLDNSDPPPPTPERASELVADLPLVEQEVVFFKLAGYSDSTIEKLLVLSAKVAVQGFERLQAGYATALDRHADQCLWPSAWLKVLEQAWAAKTGNCATARQLIRLQDGQTTWYEKDPIEQHLSRCLFCLEAWTALRELTTFRREAPELAAAEAESFLSSLPVSAPARKGKSLFRRVFG